MTHTIAVQQSASDGDRTHQGHSSPSSFVASTEICQSHSYNAKSDMWSAGCVLYELTAGKYAFQGANLRALIANIIRGQYTPIPAQFSPQLKELIAGMLDTNPRRRLSIHQVLGKPIMRRRIQNFLSKTGLQDEFSHTVIHGQPPRGALVVQAPRNPPSSGDGGAAGPAVDPAQAKANRPSGAGGALQAQARAAVVGAAHGAAGAQAAADAQARRLEGVRLQQQRALERVRAAEAVEARRAQVRGFSCFCSWFSEVLSALATGRQNTFGCVSLPMVCDLLGVLQYISDHMLCILLYLKCRKTVTEFFQTCCRHKHGSKPRGSCAKRLHATSMNKGNRRECALCQAFPFLHTHSSMANRS